MCSGASTHFENHNIIMSKSPHTTQKGESACCPWDELRVWDPGDYRGGGGGDGREVARGRTWRG